MDDIKFYLINHNNVERGNRMRERFSKLNILDKVEILEGKNVCMESHMECIKKFIDETDKKYLIVMEDDVYIHKEFLSYLDHTIKKMEEKGLTLILLGYLLGMEPKTKPDSFPLLHEDEKIRLHNYPFDLWGAQCYLIKRNYVQFLYDNLTEKYAKENCEHYSSDWTITKLAIQRALIFPMIVVEEGNVKGNDYGQTRIRELLLEWNYKPELFY